MYILRTLHNKQENKPRGHSMGNLKEAADHKEYFISKSGSNF